jgi:predicted HTH transcriptional regulator
LPDESELVEFKVDNTNPQIIGEYISALSNSANLKNKEYAYLVFGIEDETHKIVGTSFRPRNKKIGNQELENWIITQLDPKIDFKIIEQSINGKNSSVHTFSVISPKCL